MLSRFHRTVPNVLKQHGQEIWTFLFFLLLLAGFFAYDDLISTLPSTQAASAPSYPGDENWDQNFYTNGLNGVGTALVSDGSNLYVGGDFQVAGQTKLNKIGYWDGTTWHDMGGGFQGNYNSVYAVANSDDQVYVGGYFTSVGTLPGVPARNIAVWSKTTQQWSTLQSGVNGSVQHLAATSTHIYAGGYFNSAGGVQVNNLARWDIANSTWSAFGTLSVGNSIQAMVADGENVYIAGNFSQVNELPVNNVAYWDGSAWHAMGTGNDYIIDLAASNGQVYTVAESWDDTEYVRHVRRWNGTAWENLGAPLYGYNFDLEVSPDGTPVLLGAILIDMGEIYGIHQWNAGSSSFELVSQVPNSSPRSFTYHGGDLILSGEFQNIGSVCASKIARWNGSQWLPLGSSTSVNGSILSVAGPSESDLYFSGYFTCAGEAETKLITHWDGTSFQPAANGLTGSYARLAWDEANHRLYAAGYFTSDQNPSIRNVAYLENGTWHPLGNELDPMSYGVEAIYASGNSVLISMRLSGTESGYAQVYSLQNGVWQPLGQPVYGRVQSLAVMGNTVFAGGAFTKIGDLNVNNIARWDGSAWASLGAGFLRPVNSLVVSGNDLYAGGEFVEVNDDPNLSYIARWDGTDWRNVGNWQSTQVSKLFLYGNDLYAAHRNWGTDEVISRWDGTSWSRIAQLGSGRNYFDGGKLVEDMVIHHGNIFVGGSFTTAGDNASSYVAWWHSPVIRGQVTQGTTPLSGVTILTRDGRSVTTDQNGAYTLTGTIMGDTFSAVKPGYAFQPPYLSVHDANISPQIVGQNFAGIAATAIPPKPTPTQAPTAAPVRPAPVLSTISVTEGNSPLGVPVDITGANFQPVPVVHLGEYLLTDVRYIDPNHLKGVLPALPGTGYYPLVVTNPDGQSGVLQNAYRQTSQTPFIHYYSPNYGYRRFPSSMNIHGSGFKNGSTVVLIDAVGVDHPLGTEYISASRLFASIPAQFPTGTYSLKVTNPAPDAQSSQVVSAAYQSLEGTYDAIYPSWSSIWQNPNALVANTSGQIGISLYRAGGETSAKNLKVSFYLNSVSAGTKIGDANVPVLEPHQGASSTPVIWNTPAAGQYTILAVLDPDGSFASAYPAIRLPDQPIRQILSILPQTSDTVPPVIEKLIINAEGETTTSSRSAALYTQVSDASPSSGISSLYYVESTFSQATGTWSPVTRSGWVPAGVNPYPWQLSPENGIKYMQVWAADYMGNVSQPGANWINYIPAQESLKQGMTRAYRFHLTAGQQLHAVIKAAQPGSSGDADLYAWGQGGGTSTLLAWSDRPLGSDDTVLYTALAEMDVQLEVFGFTDTTYSLDVEILNTPLTTGEQTLNTTPSTKDVPAQPSISVISEPVSQIGLPVAPISTTTKTIFIPLVRR